MKIIDIISTLTGSGEHCDTEGAMKYPFAPTDTGYNRQASLQYGHKPEAKVLYTQTQNTAPHSPVQWGVDCFGDLPL